MKKVDFKVSKKYAQALFEHFQAQDLDKIVEALDSLALAWKSIAAELNNPAAPLHVRSEALSDVAQRLLPGEQGFKNFLLLLLDNSRLNSIESIALIFKSLVEDFKKLLAIEVTSAFDLPELEKNEISLKVEKAIFGKQLAKSISVTWLVNKDILGGLQIKLGDKLIDASIAGTLSKFETQVY